MATGATIPPELFKVILFYVCKHAIGLLDPLLAMPNRKEAVRDITVCSLTCLYWARIYREAIFDRISIKSYEDLRAFPSLVVERAKDYHTYH